jgi:hypothetical protein
LADVLKLELEVDPVKLFLAFFQAAEDGPFADPAGEDADGVHAVLWMEVMAEKDRAFVDSSASFTAEVMRRAVTRAIVLPCCVVRRMM